MLFDLMGRVDDTLTVATQGYGWLPNRFRRQPGDVFRTRLLGQPAVALRGPDAVRFFYDERHVRRHGAVPEPLRGTLFGKKAVHTLDGEPHRVRKAMFTALLMNGGFDGLVERTGEAWEAAVRTWAGRRVVLFDEIPPVLTRAVCAWSGIPLADSDVPAFAEDLVAMVDGFATPGPRHWKARLARGRRERWLADLVRQVRAGELRAPQGSVLAAVAEHRDSDGRMLDAETAAVEILNVIRPTVAVTWFVAFAGHALHRWPEHRDRLRADDPAFTEAFAQEVRRFYPFAPFVGGRAAVDLTYAGTAIPAGAMVLLDLYGQNHDARLWPDPYRFDPQRFVGRPIGPFDLVPQGGGDPRTGHRCPGEQITVALLRLLSVRLAQLDYQVPAQNLEIPLHRIPTRPVSGLVLAVAATVPVS
ncbi:cytochrome P450 [Micromonospora endophytica]|uniref:Cytochrome P450 n=2 Tax=Micromonospora endophytica TaxID=515350 RepID=A0A2W2CS69_9ACTN|nr:cytochrome P450 [Micromonospora endophytica]RIW43903.1 cytochrome P450 [Micromonospora endophytica]BCJ56919.1 cytochrome P450 [Micromonospora endophytica]